MKRGKSFFHKKLKHYYTKRFKHLSGYLDDCAKTLHHKTLHNLRVEIKKLMALFHLIEYCRQQTFSKNDLQPIRKIFKLSGKLRSYGINKMLSEKFGALHLFPPEDDSDIEVIANKLKAKHKKYQQRLSRLQDKYSDGLTAINSNNLHQYLDEQKSAFDKFVLHPDIDNLHAMRKTLKDVSYLVKLRLTDNSSFIQKAQLACLANVEDGIGNWHDINKFINKLQESDKSVGTGKIPMALIHEREKRLKLVEKEMSVYSDKKIRIGKR